MFQISEDELDRLTAGYTSIDQLMFGITAGASVSFGIVFLTVSPQGNALLITTAIFSVAILGSLAFGLRVLAGMRAAREHAKRLKEQPAWPLTD